MEKETILARFAKDEYQSNFSARPSIAFNEPPSAGEDVQNQISFIEHAVTWIVDEFERAFFK